MSVSGSCPATLYNGLPLEGPPGTAAAGGGATGALGQGSADQPPPHSLMTHPITPNIQAHYIICSSFLYLLTKKSQDYYRKGRKRKELPKQIASQSTVHNNQFIRTEKSVTKRKIFKNISYHFWGGGHRGPSPNEKISI